jgi:hypothetical protein
MIPSIEIVRLEETKRGTIGVLKINKSLFCTTLEPSDELNAISVSSIPAQQYICERYSSDKYPNTFQVMDVPGRTYILFHAGNEIEHTEGCILLGEYFQKLNHDPEYRAIRNSGKTFSDFMTLMEHYDKFRLTITEVY